MRTIASDMMEHGVRFKFKEGQEFKYEWIDPIIEFSEDDDKYRVNNCSYDYDFKKSEVVSYFIYKIGEGDYDYDVEEVKNEM